ncbi:hypothetical protein Xbed_02854 [Xenorhabdus beddingii]|uniref:Uncharacterized protein n=1 Tax=Xenorhabdus beddingii TaxID=40578 RepID=A0A1Y2SK74_9GAMM|nr:hypothetical protein [Xenorhabdus beddingii]OTA18868.1 hypothetical protein Xbed_02854 [Xenorhabdus beddingii]
MPGNIALPYHEIMLHYAQHRRRNLGWLRYIAGSTIGYLVDNTHYQLIRRVFVFIDVGYRTSPQPTNDFLCDDITEQDLAQGVFTLLNQVNVNCIFLAIDRVGMRRHPQIVANRCGMPVFAPQGNIRIEFQPNNINPTQCFLEKNPPLNQIKYFYPQF